MGFEDEARYFTFKKRFDELSLIRFSHVSALSWGFMMRVKFISAFHFKASYLYVPRTVSFRVKILVTASEIPTAAQILAGRDFYILTAYSAQSNQITVWLFHEVPNFIYRAARMIKHEVSTICSLLLWFREMPRHFQLLLLRQAFYWWAQSSSIWTHSIYADFHWVHLRQALKWRSSQRLRKAYAIYAIRFRWSMPSLLFRRWRRFAIGHFDGHAIEF